MDASGAINIPDIEYDPNTLIEGINKVVKRSACFSRTPRNHPRGGLGLRRLINAFLV